MSPMLGFGRLVGSNVISLIEVDYTTVTCLWYILGYFRINICTNNVNPVMLIAC